MITRAQDYLYTSPLAAGIHGKILPNVAGTGEACINRYEGIAYLVEMARERAKWDYGVTYDPTSYIARDYAPTSIVDDRETVAALCDAAHGMPNGYEIDFQSPLIPSGWTDANTYPIVVDPDDGFAWAAWRRLIPAIPLTCPTRANTPNISDADTIAKLFADFASMKRWLFWATGGVNEADFANGQGHSANGHTSQRVQIGDASGSMVTQPSRAHNPTWAWYRGYLNGQSYTEDGQIENTMRVYIKKPFVYDRLNGSLALGTGALYACWQFPYVLFGSKDHPSAYDVMKNGTTAITKLSPFSLPNMLQPVTGALADEFDAYFDYPFNGPLFQTACQNLKAAVFAKYDSLGLKDDADHIYYVQLDLIGLLVDTGVVTHVARIES